MTRVRRRLGKLGIPGELRITVTGGARAVARAEAVLDKLIEDSQVDVLRALLNDDITLAQLVDLDRRGKLQGAEVRATAALAEPLWSALERLFDLDRSTRGRSTRQRYLASAHALKVKGARWLPATATVDDLRHVPWERLRDAWDGSPADWNHLRRMLSRALTLLLGKHHATRYEILAPIPRETEREREPDVNATAFWAAIEHVREDLRPAFVCLAVTGMRVGEYLACTPSHLRAPAGDAAFGYVHVPGSKTAKSAARIAVARRLWPWIAQAVPAPLAYKWLRTHWARAVEAAGLPPIRLHDLRHLSAMLASDAGLTDSRIQPHLRHTTAAMTRRYSKRKDTQAVADAIADQLGGPTDA